MANQSKRTISLISFNAFGTPWHSEKVIQTLFKTHVYKRLSYLADFLNKSDADIVNLQEVNTFAQYFFLRSKLKSFKYACYTPYLFGPRGGVVTFSKIPFKQTKYVTFLKSGTYLNKSNVAALIKRGLLVSFLKDLPICIINTHLTHNMDHDWTSGNRFMKFQQIQLDQIVMYLKGIETHNLGIILTGDFNIPKTSPALKSFIKQAGLIDTFEEFHTTTYHEEYTFKDSKLGRVDHIYLDKNKVAIKITDKKHLFHDQIVMGDGEKIHLSDHMGLYVKFVVDY